jgi:hypothetical protein
MAFDLDLHRQVLESLAKRVALPPDRLLELVLPRLDGFELLLQCIELGPDLGLPLLFVLSRSLPGGHAQELARRVVHLILATVPGVQPAGDGVEQKTRAPAGAF